MLKSGLQASQILDEKTLKQMDIFWPLDDVALKFVLRQIKLIANLQRIYRSEPLTTSTELCDAGGNVH